MLISFSSSHKSITLIFFLLGLGPSSILCRDSHVINFLETFISDITLPSNSSILGLAVNSHRNRLLAIVHSPPPLPPFNALAAYDLRSRRRIFISLLPDSDDEFTLPNLSATNDVAVDHTGTAYVSNSAGNFIWKITTDGTASIFSKSPLFTSPENNQVTTGENLLGLNGITYVSKGYLLVVQSSTGKVFKVDAMDGTARTVSLNDNLIGADDIVVRDDNAAVAVSPMNKLWLMKSMDSWAEGVVYERKEINVKRFPTSVTVGEKGRLYVLYGHLNEGMLGDSEREGFGIAEIRYREGQDEHVWIFVLIGLGFAYFLFWRFLIKNLVFKMDQNQMMVTSACLNYH
ncbi:putative six-bladed beta-propeller, TolB [Medicago truncatula]|uniref:Putative six-bladed beta-propeller, TolB n=1 Tax=Medicago truncatula TaxID=3880 RepID=A0A396IUU8_MEDTR|nr:putative six-bladed beta-propeller, TolB [Medicago truncatula]